ncbi:MAG: DNA recombination protein RmuC [Anaerorhabdus sp.]
MDSLFVLVVVMSLVVLLLVVILSVTLISRVMRKQESILKETLYQNNKESSQDINDLRQQLQKELIQFQDRMSMTVKGDLNQLSENTVNRLVTIEKNVKDGLLHGFEKNSEAFNQVMKQMSEINQTQENLKSLSSNITNLQNVLTDKKTRGTWGEVELYSILESTFGNNPHRFEKQHKLSNGAIVDCALFAPDPLGKIMIDSKFPLENYNRLMEARDNKEEEARVRTLFKKDVLKHINDISEKYIIAGETAEIAYMFIPAEAVFAEIYGHFDEVIQESYKKKVYLVSPTTLMAYITAIKAIYLGQERNDKVEEIQKEFSKLSTEFDRFNTRFNSVVKDFDKTQRDIRDVEITSGKIMKQFKQIEAVELDSLNRVESDADTPSRQYESRKKEEDNQNQYENIEN